MPRIAFYAPLKPPDHPVPSGDREMARLLLAALQAAGFEAEIASTLRTLDTSGGRDFTAEAAAESALLLARYQAQPESRPDLWFTYHVYYKAPDLIGPNVSKALGIPYVIAEGSRAPKRAVGPWAASHTQAEAALDAADLILIPNPNDREMLEGGRPVGQVLVDLPPFIDASKWPLFQRGTGGDERRLLVVAMMREGDKLASYGILAQALALLPASSWRLDIAGDGPGRHEVEVAFAPFGDRIRFHGRIDDPNTLARFYAEADLLVWPAVNEAFGMVFLEAALQGCPSVAGDYGGVGSVVIDGETGLLAQPGDAQDFASALERLMRDGLLRARLSAGAMRFAREERSLGGAARLLREALAGSADVSSALETRRHQDGALDTFKVKPQNKQDP
ncbi:glycosyl transferase [Labrys miyagiensis]|uniref:Glycosyl transferase n=1 Tax=Labrys miyagiensis TaxID=346912 RepID=A0ABQ6CCY9_9HYPH|nr:glycosyltransferase family 4 protein [Labrys miyagiensis]GLS17542.1 glycosyl transferase [Labrys miyagiensis]